MKNMKQANEGFIARKPDVRMFGYGVVPYLAETKDPDGRYQADRELIYRMKAGDQQAIDTIVGKAHAGLKGWVTDRTVWVPLPGSAKSSSNREGEKTVLLARAFAKRFGGTTSLGLVRQSAVKKSHQSEDRTTVAEHRSSMSFTAEGLSVPNIIFVDDVATRGSTATGAALVLTDSNLVIQGRLRVVVGAWSRFEDEAHVEHMRFSIEWWSEKEHSRKKLERAVDGATVWERPLF